MKNTLKWTVIMVCMIQFLLACSEQVPVLEDRSSYQKLYIPQAARGTVAVNFIVGATEPDTVAYGAAVGGFDLIDHAVSTRFEVEDEAVAAYNSANNSEYLLLPASAYTLLDEELTIPAGQTNSDPGRLVIDPQAIENEGQYLLPIQLVDVSGQIGRYGEGINTLFIVVTIAPAPPVYHEDLDRTGWEVASYSSHDPWEGGAEGHVNSVLDGNFYTFWISQWMGGEVPFPHHIVIDMKQSQTLHGVSFMNRTFWDDYSNGQPREVTLEVSMDGESWEPVTAFTDIPAPAAGVPPAGNWVRLEFDDAVEARYFKFIVTAIHGVGSVAAVAELGAF